MHPPPMAPTKLLQPERETFPVFVRFKKPSLVRAINL